MLPFPRHWVELASWGVFCRLRGLLTGQITLSVAVAFARPAAPLPLPVPDHVVWRVGVATLAPR